MGTQAVEYILTIDQGTSSTKVVLFNTNGKKISASNRNVSLPGSSLGYIEQNPEELLTSIQRGIQDVLSFSAVNPKNVSAVAMDNQGETIIPFRKKDLFPLSNAISWQDSRGDVYIQELLKDPDFFQYVKNTTGLIPSSYFSASKMAWLMRNNREVEDASNGDNLVMATSEVWLISKLTSGQTFKTDYTTASRTMLFNIRSLCWDDKLIHYFKLDKNSLPEAVPTLENYGTTDPAVCGGIQAPLIVSIVDQQASLVGHRCLHKGDAKLTLGTGGFLQVNGGTDPVNRSSSIIKSVFIQTSNALSYLYEGQIYSVGSAIEWMKRNKILESYGELDAVSWSSSVPNLYFIPSFSGVSAPYWKSYPSAAFIGMGLQTTRKDMVRSVLEAIAFRSAQVINLLEEETDLEIKNLSLDGGVSRNRYILSLLSKITGKKIVKTESEDLASSGCFSLGAASLGVVKEYDELNFSSGASRIVDESPDPLVIERFNNWKDLFEKYMRQFTDE